MFGHIWILQQRNDADKKLELFIEIDKTMYLAKDCNTSTFIQLNVLVPSFKKLSQCDIHVQ